MPKVYGIHQIALRPGLKGEDFEEFFAKECAPAFAGTGWKPRLLKAFHGGVVVINQST